MTGFFIALLSGALMSVQGVFNTQVTKTTGMWVSNAWVQLSAFAICLVMWLIMGRDSIATIGEVQPKYMLLGGVIGAGITWTVIKSVDALGPARSALFIVVSQLAVAYLISLSGMAQLGPAKAALLIVMSQLIVAYLIELVGLFGVEKEPFSWRKVIGMGIALIGTTIFQWK